MSGPVGAIPGGLIGAYESAKTQAFGPREDDPELGPVLESSPMRWSKMSPRLQAKMKDLLGLERNLNVTRFQAEDTPVPVTRGGRKGLFASVNRPGEEEYKGYYHSEPSAWNPNWHIEGGAYPARLGWKPETTLRLTRGSEYIANDALQALGGRDLVNSLRNLKIMNNPGERIDQWMSHPTIRKYLSPKEIKAAAQSHSPLTVVQEALASTLAERSGYDSIVALGRDRTGKLAPTQAVLLDRNLRKLGKSVMLDKGIITPQTTAGVVNTKSPGLPPVPSGSAYKKLASSPYLAAKKAQAAKDAQAVSEFWASGGFSGQPATKTPHQLLAEQLLNVAKSKTETPMGDVLDVLDAHGNPMEVYSKLSENLKKWGWEKGIFSKDLEPNKLATALNGLGIKAKAAPPLNAVIDTLKQGQALFKNPTTPGWGQPDSVVGKNMISQALNSLGIPPEQGINALNAALKMKGYGKGLASPSLKPGVLEDALKSLGVQFK
jgi:hypothetical protein